MQNHGPDIVNRYQDALSLIEEAGFPGVQGVHGYQRRAGRGIRRTNPGLAVLTRR
jgi:hypothetical protein